MKRKILAVLLMMVLSMTCVACDIEEVVETGSNNVAVSMEGMDEKEEAASTPTPSPTFAATPTVAPTSTPTPTVAPTSIPSPAELLTPTVDATSITSPTELPTPTVTPTNTPTPTVTPTSTPTVATTPTKQPMVDVMVWLPATGEKYHSKNNCGRMNPSKARQVTKSEAERRGYEPCSKCY